MTSPIFKRHALSKLFPDMEDVDLQAMSDDIKVNGLHEAILLYKGEILDGFHRYQACLIADVNPRTIDYLGKNPASIVRSKNIHRRDLTPSQRALAVVQLEKWAETGNPIGKGAAAAPPPTVKKMAESARTGERIIQQAKRVAETGSEALNDAVTGGEISVEKAAKIAKLPKREQAAAIHAPPAPPEPEYTPLDEAHDTISELQDLLVLANMEGSEKDKEQAAELIKRLRAEIKTLTATLAAVTISRDTLQNENAALKRHSISLQKKLDKLKC